MATTIALLLQLRHVTRFVTRQHLGKDAVNARLRWAMASAVASLSPVIMTTVSPISCRRCNRLGRALLDGVGHADHGRGLTVHRQPHGRLGLRLQGRGLGRQPVQRHRLLLHEPQVAQQHRLAVDRGGDAVTGDRLESGRLDQRQPLLLRRTDNRLAQRMLEPRSADAASVSK